MRGSFIAGILCAAATTLACLELPPPLPPRAPDLGAGAADADPDAGVDVGPVDADVGGSADVDGGAEADADAGPERPSFPPPGLQVRAYHVGAIDRDGLEDLVIADQRAGRVYTFLGRTAFMRVIDHVDVPVVPPAAVLIADVVSPSAGSVVLGADGFGDVWSSGAGSNDDTSPQAFDVFVGGSLLRRTGYVPTGARLGPMSGLRPMPAYLAIARLRAGGVGVYFGSEFRVALIELGDLSLDTLEYTPRYLPAAAQDRFTPAVFDLAVRSSTIGAYDDLLLLRQASATYVANPGDGDYSRGRTVDAAYGVDDVQLWRHADIPRQNEVVGDGCPDVIGAWVGEVVVLRMPCDGQPRFLGPYRRSAGFDGVVDLNVGDVGGARASTGLPDVVTLRRADPSQYYLSVLPDIRLRDDMTVAPNSPPLRLDLPGAPQIAPLVDHDGGGLRSIVVVWGDRPAECFELAGTPLEIRRCANW